MARFSAVWVPRLSARVARLLAAPVPSRTAQLVVAGHVVTGRSGEAAEAVLTAPRTTI